MFIPKWILVLVGLCAALFVAWTISLAMERNPLPFPDPGSRIFAAASPEGKAAVVELLALHGVTERFKADSGGVLRSIMWDGTIVNHSTDEVNGKLGHPGASIGLVVDDPEKSAREAAAFLTSKGFTGEIILDVEPGLPIAFVKTDAMKSTVLNFRKHLIHMPRP